MRRRRKRKKRRRRRRGVSTHHCVYFTNVYSDHRGFDVPFDVCECCCIGGREEELPPARPPGNVTRVG